jgi:hypothetical protein
MPLSETYAFGLRVADCYKGDDKSRNALVVNGEGQS